MARERIVVYTAIAGGIDRLREPFLVSQGVDYVCFTDDPEATSGHWEIRPFDELLDDPVRTAKKPKILPHRYFPEYDLSLWIDGNQTIVGDLAELATHHLYQSSLAMFGHPEGRNCLYDEARACVSVGKDDPSTIHRQVERYRTFGYPSRNGMPTCMVLVRRHNEPHLVEAMEDWWREITIGSRRDQLSFPFVAWKHDLGYARIAGDVRNNRFLTWRPHEATRGSEDSRRSADQGRPAEGPARSRNSPPRLVPARDQAQMSAEVIVGLVTELVSPRSVVDVGCGDGVLFEVFRAEGIDTLGLGTEKAGESARIPPERFRVVDPAAPFSLERNFDLAVSLDVAQHLPPDRSDDFVASLVATAPVVLFSAAVPGETDPPHINLHWPAYWADLFARHRFVPIDCIRSRVWSDKRVTAHDSQNAMFFVERNHLESLPALKREAEGGFPSPPPLVHPDIFRTALRRAERRTHKARRESAARTRELEESLGKSTARERKLEGRLTRVERRLAQLETSRWWRLGQRLDSARRRVVRKGSSRGHES